MHSMKKTMSKSDNFKKGSIEMLVLHLLQEEDMYGYQLSQLIKERSGGFLSVPEGSLYPALYRLSEKQCITDYKKQIGKRLTRIYYHLEPQGREYLASLLENYYSTAKGIQSILEYQIPEK